MTRCFSQGRLNSFYNIYYVSRHHTSMATMVREEMKEEGEKRCMKSERRDVRRGREEMRWDKIKKERKGKEIWKGGGGKRSRKSDEDDVIEEEEKKEKKKRKLEKKRKKEENDVRNK